MLKIRACLVFTHHMFALWRRTTDIGTCRLFNRSREYWNKSNELINRMRSAANSRYTVYYTQRPLREHKTRRVFAFYGSRDNIILFLSMDNMLCVWISYLRKTIDNNVNGVEWARRCYHATVIISATAASTAAFFLFCLFSLSTPWN